MIQRVISGNSSNTNGVVIALLSRDVLAPLVREGGVSVFTNNKKHMVWIFKFSSMLSFSVCKQNNGQNDNKLHGKSKALQQ